MDSELSDGLYKSMSFNAEYEEEVVEITPDQFASLMDKLEAIERKLDFIFGNHFLLDGEFKKWTP